MNIFIIGHQRIILTGVLPIAFCLRKGHSAGKPLPQMVIREDAKIFVQNWTKKVFFAKKNPKN